MRPRHVALSVATLAGIFAVSDDLAGGEHSRYFPLEVGNRWTYASSGTSRQIVAEVVRREDDAIIYRFDGREIRLREEDDGARISIDLPQIGFVPHYHFDEDSFTHRDWGDCEDNRRMVVLDRAASVETRSGTYTDCLDIAYDEGACIDAGVFREWWAPDVGRVRWVESGFVGITTWELELFEPATSVPEPVAPCETQKVLAEEQDELDIFGRSVSVSGDVAIVGAWNDEGEGGPGVFAVGAAYIFRREGEEWIEEQRITAPDPATEDRFGHVVAIHGDLAVIGAPTDDDACDGFPACDSGSAYVFRHGDEGWVFEEKLVASDAEARDQFGLVLAVHEDVVAVGAPWEDEACGGSPNCNAGAVYVFRHDAEAGEWIEEKKLMAGDAESLDQLGFSVAVSEEGIVAGAPTDDDDGVSSGAVYVFEYQESREDWAQVQKLRASDAELGDHFGRAVDMHADRIIVGAVFDDDACPEDELCDSGSAYVFRKTEADRAPWVEEGKLVAADGAADDEMGEAVTISANVAVVGRRWDDSDEIDAGSAYIFRFDDESRSWDEGRKFVAEGIQLRDRFGEAVSVDGDFLWVSAPSDDEAGNGSGAAYAFDVREDCADPAGPGFTRGDANADGLANLSDAVFSLGFLFLGGPVPSCLAAANANADEAINIADATFLLNHLFLGGPAPVEPFEACGPSDLEVDEELGCEQESCE